MSKSPFKTAIAVANSMVGASLLVVPVNFSTKGIIQNSIAAVIMSIIMGATAVAIGTLVSGRQKEFYKVVKAELGVKWSNIMAILGAILPTLVACIVFLLATNIIFEVFCKFSSAIEELGEKIFRSLLILLFIPLCWLNNLELVVKFGFVSMGLMWVYLLTITFSFIQNFHNIDSGAFEYQELSINNIQFWLSVQGFSFICHPTLDAVLKQNKKSQKNNKAVMGGYLISFVIMVGCGIMGALALYKKQSKSKNNIIEYFKDSWQFFVLAISLSVYLFSIFPIFPVVARQQCYQILPAKFKQNPRKTQTHIKIIFICIFTGLCQMFIWLSVSPATVMSFFASIASFFICYLLPMLIKIKLIQKSNQIQVLQLSQSLIQSNSYIKSETNQDKTLLPKQQRSTRNMLMVAYVLIICFGAVLIFGQIWFLISNLIHPSPTLLSPQ